MRDGSCSAGRRDTHQERDGERGGVETPRENGKGKHGKRGDARNARGESVESVDEVDDVGERHEVDHCDGVGEPPEVDLGSRDERIDDIPNEQARGSCHACGDNLAEQLFLRAERTHVIYAPV